MTSILIGDAHDRLIFRTFFTDSVLYSYLIVRLLSSLCYFLIDIFVYQARQILEKEFAKLTALCPERVAHADAKSDVSNI